MRLRPHSSALGMFLLLISITGTSRAEDIHTVTIDAREFQFEPSTINAESGERLQLKLVNMGELSHNLHFKGSGIEKGTATVQKGGTATVEITVPEAGPILFFCGVPGHKQAGMNGKLRVE